MSNSDILINIVRFVVLVFLQVLLLNNVNLAGYINPYLYILFIILYPLDGNKGLLIFLSFLLGLCIDIFEDSGGVHAAACAFIAYIRPVVLKYSFGVSYEYNSVKIRKAARRKAPRSTKPILLKQFSSLRFFIKKNHSAHNHDNGKNSGK